ncbi:MAG: UPF0262 family protein [Hyphomicrobiaceae bacterium]|nr:UPF0262 family protein [Hyphomicrobiaceae bacterium]MCC0022885.1 UPF0262 family protein [Hyphomicrobiaceae bacterium]
MTAREEFDPDNDRVVAVTLDPNTIISTDPDEVHEWRVAIYDLLQENAFSPARVESEGPYALHISIMGSTILFDVRQAESYEPIAAHYLSLNPFRELIRDYFRIRDSYYEAIKSGSHFQIEAVDMGRRGLHNDAAETLRQRLANKIQIDVNTARRLFTLVCAIQPYAKRVDTHESGLPTVLFVCSMNSVRSPMAAALARRQFPGKLIARSAGARSGKADAMVQAVMEPMGIDMSVHTPHTMDELVKSHFDLVITLSDEAEHAVAERDLDADAVEHWQVDDPTELEGNRDTRLAAYAGLRDYLSLKIRERMDALLANGSQST